MRDPFLQAVLVDVSFSCDLGVSKESRGWPRKPRDLDGSAAFEVCLRLTSAEKPVNCAGMHWIFLLSRQHAVIFTTSAPEDEERQAQRGCAHRGGRQARVQEEGEEGG